MALTRFEAKSSCGRPSLSSAGSSCSKVVVVQVAHLVQEQEMAWVSSTFLTPSPLAAASTTSITASRDGKVPVSSLEKTRTPATVTSKATGFGLTTR